MSACDFVKNDESSFDSEISYDTVTVVSKTDSNIDAIENDENSLSASTLDSLNSENVLKDGDKKVVSDIENDENLCNTEVGISSFTTSPLVLYLQPNNHNNEENSINVEPNKSVLLDENRQDKRPYMCNVCRKTFKRRNHFNVHLFTHKSDKPYVCKTCNKAFTHHYFLKRHEDIHSTEKQFTCPYCNEQFSVRRYYTRHLRLHRGKTYECDACDFKCCWLRDSVEHVKSHDCAVFTCNNCDRCFTQEMNLNLHSCFKSDEKRYSCKFCHKTFRRIWNLEPHMAVHENKKSFICKVCARGFNTKMSLEAHIRSNHKEENKDKPYACQLCERTFRLEVNLKRHVKFHQRKKPKCPTPLPSKSIDHPVPIQELQSRVNRIHSGSLVAYLNIESPVSEQKLVYFIPGKNVKYACNICLKGFKNQHSLAIHYRRHTGDKPFKCTFCTWCFADPADLRRHYRTHIADNRYSCEECNKNFTRKAYMMAHFRICPYRQVLIPKITSVFSVDEESV